MSKTIWKSVKDCDASPVCEIGQRVRLVTGEVGEVVDIIPPVTSVVMFVGGKHAKGGYHYSVRPDGSAGTVGCGRWGIVEVLG